MKWIFRIIFFTCIFFNQAKAQVNSAIFRYPDVSNTRIVFAYANDLWIVSKKGGTAIRINSGPGTDSWPKFSPDGKTIAFTSNFEGNYDVCTMPATGGQRNRLTSHGGYDRLIDWKPNGDSLLFASGRESEVARYNQFYTISTKGGAVSKLPLAFAEYGSYSPDGKQLALTFESQVGRNWKRYRGGNIARIHMVNLETFESNNISAESKGADEMPMWSGNQVYFISDAGAEQRMNLWKYDIESKTRQQLTFFKEYDIHYPSLGPAEIVFEEGGDLYLYNLKTQTTKLVSIKIPGNGDSNTKTIATEKYLQHVGISPGGKEILAEARGDIYRIAIENETTENITHSSGVAERYPAWSPDGKKLAYFSDQSGEYELWLESPGSGSPKKLTSYGKGFRYHLSWSPDSRLLVFIDNNQEVNIFNLSTGITLKIDRAKTWTNKSLEEFTCAWSSDSRWLAYYRDLGNGYNAVFVYDIISGLTHQITNEFYHCSFPVFDPSGKYLYLLAAQPTQAIFSDFDNSFVYVNSTNVVRIPLTKEIPDDSLTAHTQINGPTTIIDFDGIDSRIKLLDLPRGNYSNLKIAGGKLFFIQTSNTGSAVNESVLKSFDIRNQQEKTIRHGVDNFELTPNGDKIMTVAGNHIAVIHSSGDSLVEKPVSLANMQAQVNLKEEWKQIFLDAWRMERDFFYDSTMHGLDWEQLKNHYLPLLEKASTREDVIFVIGEMIGELNTSHTYHNGGDIENPPFPGVGYLGINWIAAGKYYQVKQILAGSPWDQPIRSPLAFTNINAGTYILAVDNIPITTNTEPYLDFAGKANKMVTLTYNYKPGMEGAKTVTIKTLPDESRLRQMTWAEKNRRLVDSLSNGQVGYIFLPNTYTDGQDELAKQFNAQWNKQAFIIDNRFNSGGEIPDRLLEMLHQPLLNYWALRNGESLASPALAHTGAQVMLINGWTSSAGDALAVYFKRENMGSLIGSRTKGGLTGIYTTPPLIDGATVSVPAFRMYLPNGNWFPEGYGVEPDLQVAETPMGANNQLVNAVQEALSEIGKKGNQKIPLPVYEKR